MFALLEYLFDLLVVIIIGGLLTRALKNFFGTPPSSPGSSPGGRGPQGETIQSGETARDPVCGMFVSTELSHKLGRGAETLHFCSQECLERYQKKAAHV
jgi:YHS domain-containing protein